MKYILMILMIGSANAGTVNYYTNLTGETITIENCEFAGLFIRDATPTDQYRFNCKNELAGNIMSPNRNAFIFINSQWLACRVDQFIMFDNSDFTMLVNCIGGL